MYPKIGPGNAELTSSDVPTLENSGHSAAASLWRFACSSLQVLLPSAAPGFSEKPSGSSMLWPLISDGEGVFSSWNWGTLRSTASPDGESVSPVVGAAARLGLKLSLSQPVVAGHGAS